MSSPTREKVIELAITGLVTGGIAFAAASGFSTPREKIVNHEERIKELEKLPIIIGRMDQKIDDLVDGLGVRRRHPSAYSDAR